MGKLRNVVSICFLIMKNRDMGDAKWEEAVAKGNSTLLL